MNLLSDLNKEQLLAVKNIEGPTRIIAGPGTGKTKTIISKVLYLLENNYARPDEILMIAFTNKAVNEIIERLKSLLGDDKKLPEVYTYHGWAARFLRIEYKKVGKNHDYRILDAQDSLSIVKDLVKINEDNIKPEEAMSRFGNYQYNPEQLEKDSKSKNSYDMMVYSLFTKYCERKQQIDALDFDDLLVQVKVLLNDYPEVSEYYTKKYKYVFIDEFQDTNNVQYEIIKKITTKDSNITVVGDPDQNIYSWRGANIDIILNFNNDFNNVKTFVLKQNYRSAPKILEAANKLILNNKDRINVDLFTSNKSVEEVEINSASSTLEEADNVIKRVISLVSSGQHKLHEIAIIYRNNFISREYEAALIKNRIPYKLIGGFKFFERKEVKEVLHFLHFIFKLDDFSLTKIINIPARGVGSTSLDKMINAANHNSQTIWQYISENRDQFPKLEEFIKAINDAREQIDKSIEPSILLRDFLNEIKFLEFYETDENKVKNIEGILEQIKNSFNDFKGDIGEKATMFFQSVSLSSSSDISTSEDHITLITGHASKGTEYGVVFLVGVNKGTIPSYRATTNKEIEEERRIMYVAITRAKHKLYISYALGTDFYGKEREISEFIYELIASEPKSSRTSTTNMDVSNGDVIFHQLWGEGVIVEDQGDMITVAFKKNIGIKQLVKGHKSYNKK